MFPNHSESIRKTFWTSFDANRLKTNSAQFDSIRMNLNYVFNPSKSKSIQAWIQHLVGFYSNRSRDLIFSRFKQNKIQRVFRNYSKLLWFALIKFESKRIRFFLSHSKICFRLNPKNFYKFIWRNRLKINRN